jgi:hypothetical protein
MRTWWGFDLKTTTELSFERHLLLLQAFSVDGASQVVRRAVIPAIPQNFPSGPIHYVGVSLVGEE